MEFQQFEQGYVIRLQKGEAVTRSLHDFFRKQQISAAILWAIGALEKVRLGYFDRQQKQYLEKEFPGVYELVSFTGNVSRVDGEPFLHAHAILGDPNYATFGGHFFEGTVAVTMEVVLFTLPSIIQRKLDEETGLKLWHLTGK
ncbi:MAG: DNA-binding protein [Calditrichaeota bacterium]|nr:DNA-binding protein [Calditrichota bacterium]